MVHVTPRPASSLVSTVLVATGLVLASTQGGCAGLADEEFASLTHEDPTPDAQPSAAADLTAPLDGVAQVAGFDLAIAQAGADIDLSWADQGPGFVYDVWRSTDPHFFPDDAGAQLLVNDLAATNFVDPGAYADGVSYYYRLESDGTDEYLSTIAGKFVQPLAPGGFSLLGFPLLDTGNLDAQSLAASIPGVIEVKRWDPYKVYYAPGHPAPPWDAPNFSWNPGDAVGVVTDGTAGTTHTQLGTVPVDSDLVRTLGPGQHLVTVALSLEPTDAIGLARRETNITQLDQWDIAAQALDSFYAPQWGTNHDVEPGEPLWVFVDAPTQWPPRTPFFSEYVEGTSLNKAVELYNPTGVDFDLDECEVQIYRGGNPAVGNTVRLLGTLVAGGTFVVCDDNADDTSNCDLLSSQNFWNGDDTVVLNCGGVAFDAIGQIAFDPGVEWDVGGVSTLNRTLRRSCAVTSGDPEATDVFDPSAQWSSFAIDDVSDLGQFVCP